VRISTHSAPLRWIVAALASIAALVMARFLGAPPDANHAVTRAERLMRDAVGTVREQRARAGAIDIENDPNRTGLIGPEIAPLMTTLGQLDAKRTTTNPQMAGVITRMLQEGGVVRGDAVAIGSSGSFPGFLIASLAAVRALDARPITILSLGASSFGATDPDFNLLDLYLILQNTGLCGEPPAAVSLGGDQDAGTAIDPEIQARLVTRAKRLGLLQVEEPVLSRNVARRMEIYRNAAGGRVAVFINSGGGFANIGTSELALSLGPGLHRRIADLPPEDKRGVLHAMSQAGIPVIHLLYVRGIAQQYGLPWDPIPLPAPGASPGDVPGKGFWLLCLGYFALLAALANSRRGSEASRRE
jgi:poly-gamma-glutamate system protein